MVGRSARASSRFAADGVEPPLAGHALQRGRAAILELEPGAGDQIAHRARDQHLARRRPGRLRGRRCARRSRRACPPCSSHSPGVHAGADVEPEPANGSTAASAQRIARAGPSKLARKPSPAVSISRPRKRSSCAAHGGVVRLEQLAPAPVAELGRALGRADDVGEEHRRQHAVRLVAPPARRSGTRGSPRGSRRRRCRPTGCGRSRAARRTALRDVRGQKAGVLDVADRVVDAVDDQRRHAHRRDDVAHVDLDRHRA